MGIISKTVGKNVAQKRKARGWTQEMLAEFSRISLRQIQAIERGETDSTEKTLVQIAETLGTHPLGLYLDPSNPYRPTDYEALQRLAEDYGFVVKPKKTPRAKPNTPPSA